MQEFTRVLSVKVVQRHVAANSQAIQTWPLSPPICCC